MVTKLCDYTESPWAVDLKWVNYTVCELYLNKAVGNVYI